MIGEPAATGPSNAIDEAMTIGVSLDARAIKPPISISAEAQAALKRLVGEDGVPLHALHVTPAPGDLEGWKRLQAAANREYARAVAAVAGTAKADVETIRIGDATVHVAVPDDKTNPDRAYIDLHGGALVVGGGEACRLGARLQADRHGIPVTGSITGCRPCIPILRR